MKVDWNVLRYLESNASEAIGSSNAGSGPRTAGSFAGNEDDIANLSGSGGDSRTLRGRLDEVPEMRGEKVAELQQMVSAGTYQISPSRIADAILTDAGYRLT